jgi:glutamate--cysteine ligase
MTNAGARDAQWAEFEANRGEADIAAGMELSTQILIREALRRGCEVDILDRGDNFIRLRRGDRVEYVKQATKTSVDAYIAPLIMENKEVTKRILREHGIRVPDGTAADSPEEAERALAGLAGKDVVVKPKMTNFGLGVSILKRPFGPDAFREAVALAFAHDKTILLEEFIAGREYRFLVIGDETVAVLYRVPANVTGDGVHTIAELVAEKNKDPRRGTGHVKPLEQIRLGQVERAHLAARGLTFDSVPAEGEVVYLRENSNISTGGDSIDCTDEMPAFYKRVAERAARAVGARICGVDMIVPDIGHEGGEDAYCIIELNFNPAIHMHAFPYKGKNRNVAGKVLDLLGFR